MTWSLLRRKSIAAESAAHGLSRNLGLLPLTMLGVGGTIGTGIFFVMTQSVPKAGPAVLLAFVIAGVTALLTALCYAELASAIPASGSAYSYVYVTMGEFPAFVVAACLILEYAVAASATAIGWSDYLANFFQEAFGWALSPEWRSPMLESTDAGAVWHPGRINLPPMILVGLCALLLCRGARESTSVNTVMVFLKLAVLAFFIFVAARAFDASHFAPFMPHGIDGVTAAAGTVFFTFIGLDAISTGASEAKLPRRDIPRATVLAAFIVIAFYMMVATAALGAQTSDKFAGQEAGLAVILHNVTGVKWPGLVLAAGAVISVFSVTLVTLYGQTRIMYIMSSDGLIPRVFSRLTERRHVPARSSVIVCLAVAAVAGIVDANFLWDTVSLGTLLAFFAVSLSVPMLRRREGAAAVAAEGRFRLPFGPYVIPGVSAVACLYVMHDLPRSSFIAAGCWLVVCIGYYVAVGYKQSALNKAGAAA